MSIWEYKVFNQDGENFSSSRVLGEDWEFNFEYVESLDVFKTQNGSSE